MTWLYSVLVWCHFNFFFSFFYQNPIHFLPLYWFCCFLISFHNRYYLFILIRFNYSQIIPINLIIRKYCCHGCHSFLYYSLFRLTANVLFFILVILVTVSIFRLISYFKLLISLFIIIGSYFLFSVTHFHLIIIHMISQFYFPYFYQD